MIISITTPSTAPTPAATLWVGTAYAGFIKLKLISYYKVQHFHKKQKYTCLTYQAAGNNSEEVASDNGAQELSNPVEEAGEDGDLAAESQSKGDCRVNVTAGDVGSDGNRHEECKSMANRNRYQPRWVKSRIRRQLVCIHNKNLSLIIQTDKHQQPTLRMHEH